MNILLILSLLFGSTTAIYYKDLENVKRRVQSSMNYGSSVQNNYKGSGVESNQGSANYGSNKAHVSAVKGSMNYGSIDHKTQSTRTHSSIVGSSATKKHGSSNHGSIAMKRHGSQKHGSMNYGSHNAQKHSSVNHGSTAIKRHESQKHGSMNYGSQAQKHSSINHGSTAMKRHGSMNYGSHNAQKHSSVNHGSTAIKKHGSMNYGSQTQKHSSVNHGSTAMKRHGSQNKGSYKHSNIKYMSAYVFSATTKGSTKNSYCSRNIGSNPNEPKAFSPTMEPTEQLPETYSAPPPTHYPTTPMWMRGEPIVEKQSDDINIPPLSLSFQIKQGGNGWSIYPLNNTLLTNAVSKVTGLYKKYIIDMHTYQRQIKRQLSTQIYFYYNISLPISDINTDPKNKYNIVSNILQTSVKNGAFTNFFKQQGIQVNITSVITSPYTIVYQPKQTTQSTTIESNASNATNPTLYYFYVVFASLVSFGGFYACAYFVYKRKVIRKIEPTFTDSIPNPMQKRIQLTSR
jgi:hypothetical protein